jgi:hypothetical protein
VQEHMCRKLKHENPIPKPTKSFVDLHIKCIFKFGTCVQSVETQKVNTGINQILFNPVY